jgi:DNA-binding LacI/PurR family transcriptional regulator
MIPSSTRRSTLQDVADLSRVSRGTASRALTGSGRVSAETRSRVLDAARTLRYSTNSGARNLRRARAGSIGLWLPGGMNFMEYYMNFAFGVVESTKDRELTVSLIRADFPAAKARSLHVDGFVMTDVIGGELVPPGMPQPSAAVAADHRRAISQMLDRLRDGGATSIAVIRPDVDQMWVHLAVEGAITWSTTAGVPVAFVDLDGVPSAEELRQKILHLQASHPDVDAIVCLPEGLAVGILSTLQELGRAVPDDIQLVSYNDSPALLIVQPPISSLDLRAKDAGARAGELLIAIIEGGDRPEQEVESFDLIYRDRASTRRPRS